MQSVVASVLSGRPGAFDRSMGRLRDHVESLAVITPQGELKRVRKGDREFAPILDGTFGGAIKAITFSATASANAVEMMSARFLYARAEFETAIGLLAHPAIASGMDLSVHAWHDRFGVIAGRVSGQGEIPLAMTATGIHLTDLFLDLVGPIETVTAFPATRMSNTGYADTLSVHFGFASKATGYLSTVLATPFYSRLTIFGSEAWAEVRDSSHPDDAGASTLTVQYRKGLPSVTKLSSRDSVRANLERFALSIEGKASYPFTEEQILDNIAVMSAVSRSIASGRSVSMKEVLSRRPI